MGKLFISAVAFFAGAYMQKKFDVCGKLENAWVQAQEPLKSESTDHVESKE